jgi:hypothetical protein
MTSIQDQLQQSVNALVDLEDSEIETELGRRLSATKEELEKAENLSAAAAIYVPLDKSQLAAAPVWLQRLGQAFLERLNAQMYKLVCDPRDEDNAKIRQVASAGVQQLGMVIAGILVASFGLLPGLAAAVAVIFAKRIAKAGQEALCATWRPTPTPPK